MRILFPILFVLIAAAGFGGLLMYKATLHISAQAPAQADGTAQTTSTVATALQILFEDASGAAVTRPEGDLRGMLPDAPEGWFFKTYETADGAAITGVEMIDTMISKGTTNDLLMAFHRDSADVKSAQAGTYIRGSLNMAMRIRLLSQINSNTVRGGMLAHIVDEMNAIDFGDGSSNGGGLFARYDGIDFVQLPQIDRRTTQGEERPVAYRTFEAKIGSFIEIVVITNAADAHVGALLSGLDMAALMALLQEPPSDYRPGVGFVVAAGAPLSDQPPGPSIAMQAYDILHDGQIYPPTEVDLLERIAAGKLRNWSDLTRRDRESYEPTTRLTALLGPEPHDMMIPREARQLYARETTNGSSSVTRLLARIASERLTTQAEVRAESDYDAGLPADILALIARMPVGQPVETATPAETPVPAQRPVVRRGAAGVTERGVCTLEMGIRRCVLTNEG